MSRFAASRDPTASASSAKLARRKVTVNNSFRLDVNQTLDSNVKLREEARTFVAVNRVTGGEVPTCSGSVNVGKGSGSALLAAVNQIGEFSAAAPAKPVPLSKSVRREVSASLKKSVGQEDRVRTSVIERRSGKPLEEAWDSHVEGLASSNRDDILKARKADYEERRKWLREMLNRQNRHRQCVAMDRAASCTRRRMLLRNMQLHWGRHQIAEQSMMLAGGSLRATSLRMSVCSSRGNAVLPFTPQSNFCTGKPRDGFLK